MYIIFLSFVEMKFEENLDILKGLGKKLRTIRKEKGLSMESLAHEAQIEYRQLGRIERGEINTTILSLKKIADALEIDIYQLFMF
jgi:transcriptional regulator with XRE-family HTH domain